MFNKKYLFVVVVLCVISILASAFRSNAQTAIIENSTAKSTIYLDATAPSSVKLAATQLQKYLKEISGVELPITSDSSQLSGFVIYLGDTAFARNHGIQTQQLPSDGYRILSNKNWMIIAGKDYAGQPQVGFNNPYRINESYNTVFGNGSSNLGISAFGSAGTQFGVYYFLEQYCGVRWYMPGPLGTVIPKNSKIIVPLLNLRKAPAFSHRYAYYCFMSRSDDDALWYRHAGFGDSAPIQISHSFGQFFLKYKDTHPEYFALIDGKRDFTNLSTVGGGNFNLSDPGFVQQVIHDAIQYFDEHPTEKIYPLCPNDGMTRISEDPVSQSQIDRSRGAAGKFSNYVWDFINKVAKGVAKKYPNKQIGCIAYEGYSLPPSNIARLNPNVAVVICKLRMMYPDPKIKKDTEDRILAWSKKTDNLYVWEYYCNSLFNSSWRGYPMFFSKLLQDDLKFEHAHGIKGEFIEAESWVVDDYSHAPDKIIMNYPGLQHLLLYTTAKLMWNPDLNLPAMLNEYYRLFYGPAKKPMRQFWQTVDSNWMQKGWSSSPTNVYDQATITKLLDYLNEAQKTATAGSVYRKRIDLIYDEFKPATEAAQRLETLAKPTVQVIKLNEQAQGGSNAVPTISTASTVMQFLDRNYKISSPATNMQLAWDAKNLYVDLRCYEPDMSKLKTLATEHDSISPPIWEDDSVELFIMPDATAPDKGLHFIITAGGAIYDAKTNGIGTAENSVWNSNTQITVKKEASSWIARVAIPWSDMGVTNPQPGRKIMANFYRNRYAGGSLEQSSWAPLKEGIYNSPQDFGTLTLSNLAPAASNLLNPVVIVPASVKDYGSGASLQGFYGEGGVPGVGLFVGQPNTLTRNDRAVFKFDLKPLLESGQNIQKVELAFGITGFYGKASTRVLDVQHFQGQPLSSVGPETVSREKGIDNVGDISLTSADAKAARTQHIDVTPWIKSDIAKGHLSAIFRFKDILAEKEGNPLAQPAGVIIANTADSLPALIVTMAQ